MRTSTLMLGAALCAGLTGCQNTRYATFVTKTSLSIADVDTAPPEASIAFVRNEGYIGPRYENGDVYPVVGFIDAGGSALMRQTVQVFAGGNAAKLVMQDDAPAAAGSGADIAIAPPNPANDTAATCKDNRGAPALYFSTATSVGLRAGFAEDTSLPTSFSLGYRRKELALVPVSHGCEPSILAMHDSDGGASGGGDKTKLAVSQYFATGKAADLLASKDATRKVFTRPFQAAIDVTAPAPAASAVR